MEWTKSIWTMNAESARRIGHPAPFPEELPNRLIQLYSFKGDIILDPFMGSGTTAVSATKSGRNFVGYDISQEYINIAEKRISPFLNQTKIKFELNGYNPPPMIVMERKIKYKAKPQIKRKIKKAILEKKGIGC